MKVLAKNIGERKKLSNECASCGRKAIATSPVVYRFVAISDTEVALFCKGCADKVHKFAKEMMKK